MKVFKPLAAVILTAGLASTPALAAPQNNVGQVAAGLINLVLGVGNVSVLNNVTIDLRNAEILKNFLNNVSVLNNNDVDVNVDIVNNQLVISVLSGPTFVFPIAP